MPTYNYECSKCLATLELVHRISMVPMLKCACGAMSRSLADSMQEMFGQTYTPINRVILTAPAVNIPYQHTAVGQMYPGDKARYYGVTDPITGEGITAETGPGGGRKDRLLGRVGVEEIVSPVASQEGIEVVGYELT